MNPTATREKPARSLCYNPFFASKSLSYMILESQV